MSNNNQSAPKVQGHRRVCPKNSIEFYYGECIYEYISLSYQKASSLFMKRMKWDFIKFSEAYREQELLITAMTKNGCDDCIIKVPMEIGDSEQRSLRDFEEALNKIGLLV